MSYCSAGSQPWKFPAVIWLDSLVSPWSQEHAPDIEGSEGRDHGVVTTRGPGVGGRGAVVGQGHGGRVHGRIGKDGLLAQEGLGGHSPVGGLDQANRYVLLFVQVAADVKGQSGEISDTGRVAGRAGEPAIEGDVGEGNLLDRVGDMQHADIREIGGSRVRGPVGRAFGEIDVVHVGLARAEVHVAHDHVGISDGVAGSLNREGLAGRVGGHGRKGDQPVARSVRRSRDTLSPKGDGHRFPGVGGSINVHGDVPLENHVAAEDIGKRHCGPGWGNPKGPQQDKSGPDAMMDLTHAPPR